jgi:hypothetical protein
MKKDDYTQPTETWLRDQFKDIPFGIMRPSEIEIILSFFIIYHNENDIEDDESKLAVKYRITESKARKLKIEFAQRYGYKNDIAGIIIRSFENGEYPFELSEDNKSVSFMIKDPYELKLIKDDLFEKKIVYYGDFNGKLIKVSIPCFVRFMVNYYEKLKKPLKNLINEKLDENDNNNKIYWKSLRKSRQVSHILKTYAPGAINGILSLAGIGIQIPGLKKALG